MSALKIVHRSRGSHDEVVYIMFLLRLQVWLSLKVAVHGIT